MNSTAVTLRSQQCCCSIWRQAAIYWEQNLQQKGLELVDEYYRVIRSLPAWLAHPLEQLPSELACSIHELRFRTDQRISLTMSGMPLLLGELPECPASLRALRLTALQMEEILYALCGGSAHTHQTELAQGYVTAVGGCRAGIAGRFVVRNGQLVLQKITSVNFRIARNIPIFLPPELCNVLRTGNFAGLLIAGEPGSGKTTLLRRVAEELGIAGRTTAVIDERGELFPEIFGPVPPNVDVLAGVPKEAAIQMALRTLSPQVILLDELGGTGESAAVERGFFSGVDFIASIHASGFEDARRRPQVSYLLQRGIIKYFVLLRGKRTPGEIQEMMVT